ncbi:uncharacterized protein N7482_006396 [Penicillium canariense]|uniref:Major facilitator superfamily (MFS) profile domain-containing protein n=1 Tax=Penicillium canariense TaxID=189055 RepID=A0A9W9LI54_9EURO|nr:uncharacterized protein N7482_006396 [Penicillium canariense]KAJ5159392.1 hypothetical protein N7482_006396 [Penicillium canariense]
MADLYGRAPLLHFSNILSTVASFLSAVSPNVGILLIGRVLMGVAGCVPTTIGGSVVADLIPAEKRGTLMSLWACGPLLGSVVGPIIGGYISFDIGWRWALRMECILCGLSILAGFMIFQETHGPTVIRKIKSNSLYSQRHNVMPDKTGSQQARWEDIRKAIVRSVILQTTSPVVIIASIYTSTAFTFMYFTITTFPILFGNEYGFNEAQIGLTYIGQGLGFASGQLAGPALDWYIKQQRAKNGHSRPKDRLPAIVPGCLLIAIGLLWYGWSAQARLHWVMPIIGSGLSAAGITVVFAGIQTYLIDAFTAYAASVIAANVTVRSIFGTVMPLGAPPLYARFGYGWGNSMLALIALGLIPVVAILYHYEKLWKMLNPRGQPSWTHPKEVVDC